MKISVGNIEGKTNKAGVKQNKVYTIISERTNNFFSATTENGKQMTIWNVEGDWSIIGIAKEGNTRYSYTTDFKII